MNLLLDTHVFLWWCLEPSQLSARALSLCESPENSMILSVASVWEMQIKLQIGKLRLESPLSLLLELQQQTNGLKILPISLQHVLAIDTLPLLHKDPFDRILLAQAQIENLMFVSADTLLKNYSSKIIWS